MLELRKRLPPLDTLIAFEAAARHASFARAANELNVTPSAVSQQIRTLETQLGFQLFERRHRAVELTDRGRLMQNSVTFALMHLLNAADEARADDAPPTLEIVTDTSVAGQWLLPRLSRFAGRHPDIAVRLTATDIRSEVLDAGVDLAILHGNGDWPGYVAERLFDEDVFPVCAPDYLARQGGTIELESLPRADLLDIDFEHWQWMNWNIWLTEAGVSLPEGPRRLRMNNYPMIIDAARRGMGIALGWRHFVDADLEAGALVRPVPQSVTTDYAYYVARPYNAVPSPTVEAFRAWLMFERDEATASAATNA